MKYDRLHVCRLSRESRAKTCGYWFVVTSRSTAHTAFRTRRGLDLWLSRLGLALTGPLDKAGDMCDIVGDYERVYTPADSLSGIDGEKTRELHNGDYVDAVISRGPERATVYVSHPGAAKHNYAESQSLAFGDWDEDEDRACAALPVAVTA